MINADMRLYDYCTLGDKDAYGQPQLPTLNTFQSIGQVKMAINHITTNISDNIKFKDCSYLGLTKEKVDDTYIIFFENQLLKVLYVIPKGRFKQVYLAEM